MTGAPSAPEPAAEWKQVAVCYPFELRDAVNPVDLHVAKGERVLLLGPSGSGKSTLLLTLTGLIPSSVRAELTGKVELFATPAETRRPAEWADTVAWYFQDPEQSLCGMRVSDEISFALENRNLPPAEIEARTGAAMAALGLPDEWRTRRSLALSGGEKQLVALAAALAQDAPILVADEPTAHLAPEAAAALHAAIAALPRDRSAVIVDHRLDGMLGLVDRVVVLGRNGRIIANGPPRQVFRCHGRALAAQGIWRPSASDLDARLAEVGLAPARAPLTVAEALAELDPGKASDEDVARAVPAVEAFVEARRASRTRQERRPVVELRQAAFAPFAGRPVLERIDLTVAERETVALMGRNGSGKTTLLHGLAGLLRPASGSRSGEPGGIAFQRPETQFSQATVLEEAASMLPRSLPAAEREARARAALAEWRLEGLEARHPYRLSQGEKRRLALAALAASDRWPLIGLDEPTAGLDHAASEALGRAVLALAVSGRAVVVVTHDVDFAARWCERLVLLDRGRIVADGPSAELFRDAALLARCGLVEPSHSEALRWLERVGRC